MWRKIIGWLGLAVLVASSQADVLITEIMYDPALSNEHEYVELYNNGPTAVDLNGWTLRDNPAQDTPGSVILTGPVLEPGETVVLVRVDETRLFSNYTAAWGSQVNLVAVDPWPVYSNGGDLVQLLDANNNMVASIDYSESNGYPFPNDAASIYMLDPNSATPYDGSNWALSEAGVDCARRGAAPRSADIGSPGDLPGACAGDALPDVLITEIMYDNALNNEHEYVELYNRGNTPIELADWMLSDDPSQTTPNVVTLTDGIIHPGCTAVLVRIDSARIFANYISAWGVGVNFIGVTPWPVYTNGGDTVELYDPNGNTIASVNYRYDLGFPFPEDGPSIYMLDINAEDLYGPDNWALSSDGVDGAHYGETPRAADIGSPGFVSGPKPGDCNGDSVVDDLDLPGMLECILGPDNGLGVGCECADIDADGDVDMADLASFYLRFGC